MRLRFSALLFLAGMFWQVQPLDAQANCLFTPCITPSPDDFDVSQLASWFVGVPWTVQFTSPCGSVQPVLDGLPTPLPSSIVWTATSGGGKYSGTFAVPGVFRFRLQSGVCRDPANPTGTSVGLGTYYVTVSSVSPMSMTSGPYLPPCNVGANCPATLTQGGSPIFTAKLVSGSLPPGASLLASGVTSSPSGVFLTGTPTTSGVYTFQVSVTDGSGQTGSATYTIVVSPTGEFYASTDVLSFSAVAGSAAQTQPLGVGMGDLSTVKFAVTSDSTWLTATPASGSTPASLSVRMDPSKISSAAVTGHLTLTPDSGKTPVTVTVNASIGDAVPLIGVAPQSVEIDLPPVPNAAKTYQLGFHAWNAGAGTLTAQVSATTLVGTQYWLTVQPGQITATPGQTQPLTVNVDASTLDPGTYQASIQLKSAIQTAIVPVTLVVPTVQYVPSLRLSVPALGAGYLQTFSDEPNTLLDRVLVYNDYPQAMMNFTVAVTGFGSDLVLTPVQDRIGNGAGANGSDNNGDPVKISLDPTKYSVGRHEGLIQVTALGALNSPAAVRLAMDVYPYSYIGGTSQAGTFSYDPVQVQADTPVVVAPPGSTALIPAQLTITNSSNMPVTFTVTSPSPAVSFDQSSYLAPANGSAVVMAKVDPTQLGYRENIFELDTNCRAVLSSWGLSAITVAGIVMQGASPSAFSPNARFAADGASPAAACSPTQLVLVPAAPPTYFRRLADWPADLKASIYDDCGNAVADAAITASFSNGDAAETLALSDASKGLYQASWIPGAAAGNMSITLRASKGSLTPATAQIFGAVIEDAGAPVISSMVNNANPSALAVPGGAVAISGSNLAGASASATSVLIGGLTAALLSVSATQIVAKVPATLAPNARYDVVVLVGDRVSTPKSVLVGPAPSIPAPATVGPSWGSGTSGTFTFTFSDSAGWQSLTVVDVLINNVLDGRQACYVAFVPSGANSGSVYLVDNAGDAGGPYSGMVLPGSGTVSNSQCSIAGAGSSVAGSGNTLTLTLAITFTASFAGNKVMYVAAQDASANSGWQPLGCWDAPGPTVSGPAAAGVSPAHTTGMGPTTYTFTFTDTNGWQDISVANILINSAINGVGACYVAFVPSGAGAGSVYLVDDAGDAAGPYSGMVLPGSGTVHNSQCSIAGTGSSVTAGGNTLTLTLAVTFSSSFTGNRIVYLAAGSSKQNSGWQAMGMAGVQ